MPQFRNLVQYDNANPDILSDSVLDQVDANGDLAAFESYYLYRIVPSLPNWNSMIVFFDDAYRAERRDALQMTQDQADVIAGVLRSVDGHLPERHWAQAVGKGFLEPVATNLPFDLPASELPDTKAKNNRLAFQIVIDRWTPVRRAKEEIERRFYDALLSS